MKEVVLITGANGMFARYLALQLADVYMVRFLTRKVTDSNEYLWDLDRNYIDANAFKGVQHIIHLAGASIVDKRWTNKCKEVIRSSRIDSARLILDKLDDLGLTISSFISASAIGYYGATTSNTVYQEDSPKGPDFLSTICSQWEEAAFAYQAKSIAQCVAVVRMGVVLSTQGGALSKMMLPIRYGLGSAIGTGHQYMPWIHIKDLSGLFQFLLKHQISGIFNGVAPMHVTNIELTKLIAKTLGKPLLLPHIPRFIMQALLGERAVMLLEGSRVSADKIKDIGFNFEYPDLRGALDDILLTGRENK